VKVLHPQHHDDLVRISARWAEQAELLRFVTHPSVIAVREYFEGAAPHAGAGRTGGLGSATPDRALYLVMNWVAGLPLRDWLLLHGGREGTVHGLRLLEQVADALEMLHAGRVTPSGRPVVHGDLSPGNVMVSDEGRAVLVDFGLVRLASHCTRAAAGTPRIRGPGGVEPGGVHPGCRPVQLRRAGFLHSVRPRHRPRKRRSPSSCSVIPSCATPRPIRSTSSSAVSASTRPVGPGWSSGSRTCGAPRPPRPAR
jgi:serine/threonine protein kinase